MYPIPWYCKVFRVHSRRIPAKNGHTVPITAPVENSTPKYTSLAAKLAKQCEVKFCENFSFYQTDFTDHFNVRVEQLVGCVSRDNSFRTKWLWSPRHLARRFSLSSSKVNIINQNSQSHDEITQSIDWQVRLSSGTAVYTLSTHFDIFHTSE